MRVAVTLACIAMACAAGCAGPEEVSGYDGRADDFIATPRWAERSPTVQDIRRAYPQGAMDEGVEGRVVLVCTIMPSRDLACTVDTDERPGYGFGQAALDVAKLFRVKPAEPGASTAVGRTVRVPIRFVLG